MKLEDGFAHVHALLLVGRQPKEGVITTLKLTYIVDGRIDAVLKKLECRNSQKGTGLIFRVKK
jgi:hypothetical protein